MRLILQSNPRTLKRLRAPASLVYPSRCTPLCDWGFICLIVSVNSSREHPIKYACTGFTQRSTPTICFHTVSIFVSQVQESDFLAELPPLETYAQFEDKDEVRTVGYTETTHGCKHLCTHCPIPPVYNGKFFAVQRDTVLAEIGEQVVEGATHITFGDPDFLNGPMHGLRILRAMHESFPSLTFDFTTKIEHILKNREHFREFAQLGCRFVISAVETLNEQVLTILEKHHTRADVADALDIVHGTGIALRPTWVPFTPWTTLDDYLDLLQFIETHGLVYHVDPVQYAVRLLIPPGSYLLNRPETKALSLVLDEASFSYTWVHPDARMDELHKTVNALVENDARAGVDALETFYRIWTLAADMHGHPPPKQRKEAHLPAPRLTEAWFC